MTLLPERSFCFRATRLGRPVGWPHPRLSFNTGSGHLGRLTLLLCFDFRPTYSKNRHPPAPLCGRAMKVHKVAPCPPSRRTAKSLRSAMRLCLGPSRPLNEGKPHSRLRTIRKRTRHPARQSPEPFRQLRRQPAAVVRRDRDHLDVRSGLDPVGKGVRREHHRGHQGARVLQAGQDQLREGRGEELHLPGRTGGRWGCRG